MWFHSSTLTSDNVIQVHVISVTNRRHAAIKRCFRSNCVLRKSSMVNLMKTDLFHFIAEQEHSRLEPCRWDWSLKMNTWCRVLQACECCMSERFTLWALRPRNLLFIWICCCEVCNCIVWEWLHEEWAHIRGGCVSERNGPLVLNHLAPAVWDHLAGRRYEWGFVQ